MVGERRFRYLSVLLEEKWLLGKALILWRTRRKIKGISLDSPLHFLHSFWTQLKEFHIWKHEGEPWNLWCWDTLCLLLSIAVSSLSEFKTGIKEQFYQPPTLDPGPRSRRKMQVLCYNIEPVQPELTAPFCVLYDSLSFIKGMQDSKISSVLSSKDKVSIICLHLCAAGSRW